jgi:hypothetical protein
MIALPLHNPIQATEWLAIWMNCSLSYRIKVIYEVWQKPPKYILKLYGFASVTACPKIVGFTSKTRKYMTN